jgi:RNA polymerase sigma-70 factor (ECF subfamily)
MLKDSSADAQQDLRDEHKKLMQSVSEDRNKLAFGQLFDHFAPLLRSFSLARDPGATLLADDLAQEVMIKVWNKAHTYHPDKAAVSTWIFTLARNARIDYLRKNGRFSTDIDPTSIFETIEDDSSDPFQLAQEQRISEKINQKLQLLPIEQSQVLAKIYLEGKSHQETANELTLPLGTVKSRVRLALQKLELMLKR